jgi:hypothetical protein
MLVSVGAIPAGQGRRRAATADGEPDARGARGYQADGGAVREVVFDGYGHSPRLERPVAEFRGALVALITG